MTKTTDEENQILDRCVPVYEQWERFFAAVRRARADGTEPLGRKRAAKACNVSIDEARAMVKEWRKFPVLPEDR